MPETRTGDKPLIYHEEFLLHSAGIDPNSWLFYWIWVEAGHCSVRCPFINHFIWLGKISWAPAVWGNVKVHLQSGILFIITIVLKQLLIMENFIICKFPTHPEEAQRQVLPLFSGGPEQQYSYHRIVPKQEEQPEKWDPITPKSMTPPQHKISRSRVFQNETLTSRPLMKHNQKAGYSNPLKWTQ